MELIPGLPNHIACECLYRLPFNSFPFLLPVSKAWNREIRSPDFHRRRRILGHARPVFILVEPGQKNNKGAIIPALMNQTTGIGVGIFMFEPSTGIWTRLPPMPDRPIGPDILGVADVGLNRVLVITAGSEPTWKGFVRSVHVVHLFDFLTGQWRRVADMPGPPGRAGFGLASDPARGRVLVAGARSGKQWRETLMYDVAGDEWAYAADMANERISCSVTFHAGRFHVMGGRGFQGIFQRSVESLNPENLVWERAGVLEGSVREGSSVVENGEGELYLIDTSAACGGHVFVRRGSGEVAVEEFPEGVRRGTSVVTWRDKMLVNGVDLENEGCSSTWLMDVKSGEWAEVDMPEGYTCTRFEKGCGMCL